MICNIEITLRSVSKRRQEDEANVVVRIRSGARILTRQKTHRGSSAVILDSSMVEHPAVNRRVVGSSPTRGVAGDDASKGNTRIHLEHDG